MLLASCIPFPFSTLCDDMLTMPVCATHWLSMHLYMLAYMSMHESCFLVCCPYFNTIKLWTSDPNLHLSPVNTTFCLPFYLFVFFLVCLFACLLYSFLVCLFACLSCGSSCLLPYAILAISILLVCFVPFAHDLHIFFFPLLVCWFLVLVFACTHMEWGRMELGHSLLGASKKGEDVSMWI